MASIQVDILTALRIWGYALQDQLSRGTGPDTCSAYGSWGICSYCSLPSRTSPRYLLLTNTGIDTATESRRSRTEHEQVVLRMGILGSLGIGHIIC